MNRVNFSNVIFLFPVLWRILSSLRKQQKFLGNQYGDLFREIKEKNDGTVTTDDFFKMTRYYGYAVPAILGEGICLLRGYKMTPGERRLSTSQGIITGIYDDFIDKNNLLPGQILEITRSPKDFNARKLIDKIFVENWQYVTENTKNQSFLWEMVDKIYTIQLETRKQLNPETSYGQIREITYHKGGYSVLFYRSVYSNPLIENEYHAFYSLGALLQFGNDIFDLKDDLKEGIYTMITKPRHLKETVEHFNVLKKETIGSFLELSYPLPNKKRFLHYIMPVVNRCEVCLSQLHQLEKRSGVFNPSAHTRREIVCDMEKRVNFFRTLSFYLRTCI